MQYPRTGLTAVLELIARQLVEEPFVGAAYRLTMEESSWAMRVTSPYPDATCTFEALLGRAAAAGVLRAGINVESLARCGVFFHRRAARLQHTDQPLRPDRTDSPNVAVSASLYFEIHSLHHQLEAARSMFISHYVKSRSDLSEEWT